jgi:hypothetical protein
MSFELPLKATYLADHVVSKALLVSRVGDIYSDIPRSTTGLVGIRMALLTPMAKLESY